MHRRMRSIERLKSSWTKERKHLSAEKYMTSIGQSALPEEVLLPRRLSKSISAPTLLSTHMANLDSEERVRWPGYQQQQISRSPTKMRVKTPMFTPGPHVRPLPGLVPGTIRPSTIEVKRHMVKRKQQEEDIAKYNKTFAKKLPLLAEVVINDPGPRIQRPTASAAYKTRSIHNINGLKPEKNWRKALQQYRV